MIDLLTYLYTQISSILPNTFYEKVPQEKSFPYVVYTLPGISEEEVREDYTLEIDIWSNSNDIMELETIVTDIDCNLNRELELNDGFMCKIYRNTPYRLNIPDPDENLNRRKLRYLIKLYRRS